MHVHDQVLEFLKVTGPTVPTKVAKTIKTDIIIASAHLSDLASQGRVRISALKVGGSPLYYLPGQEERLFEFAASNLNPKDMAVLERLKKEKVLREETLDLLSKVALRALKDFAVPLQVRTQDRSELFWKWHLLPDESTNQLVRDILYPPQVEEPAPELPPPTLTPVSHSVPFVHEVQQEQKMIAAENGEEKTKSVAHAPKEREMISSAEPAANIKKRNIPTSKNHHLAKDQAVLLEKETPSPRTMKKSNSSSSKVDLFSPAIERFFRELNITVQDQEIVRKNGEINFTLKVPTVVGKMTYFCKAKKKARCDEKDLSTAYMEAQVKKLPLLFLYTHDLTKKAQEMMAANAFENSIVKRVE
ncbi:hypothetical protein HY496_01940 [Candidatus Woesearchaeota archaeon]|nr:hypothetical protein [Candidatus Woesearchaeota archaeon]